MQRRKSPRLEILLHGKALSRGAYRASLDLDARLRPVRKAAPGQVPLDRSRPRLGARHSEEVLSRQQRETPESPSPVATKEPRALPRKVQGMGKDRIRQKMAARP